MGGIKLSDKISWDSKVGKFSSLRATAHKSFSSRSEFKDRLIPKWEDDMVWKRHYENGNKSIYLEKGAGGNDVVKSLSGPEDLRDTCYEIIMREAGKHDHCNANWGWCETCLMNKGWYGTSEDY